MRTIRILVAGDWHGNTQHAVNLINKAGDLKIQHILQVGDFGLWTHSFDGHVYLDEVQDAARANNLSVYAIGGNHENWDHWNHITDTMPGSKGFHAVRSRILLSPKYNGWTWAGKTFGIAGGAVSVDRDFRLASERGGSQMTAYGMRNFGRGTGPRTQYWPNEQFTDEDLEFYKYRVGKVDYLFTHDCSDHTPFEGRLKPDLDSQIHRQRIDKVINSAHPKMHFHGHMHTRYDWENARSLGQYGPAEAREIGLEPVRTIGLECDGDKDSWGVLDVESGTWLWPDDVSASVERRKSAKEGYSIIKSSTD